MVESVLPFFSSSSLPKSTPGREPLLTRKPSIGNLPPNLKRKKASMVVHDLLGITPVLLGVPRPGLSSKVSKFLGFLAICGLLSPIGYTAYEGWAFGVRDSLVVRIVLLLSPIFSLFQIYSYLKWNHIDEIIAEMKSAELVVARRNFRIMQAVLTIILLAGLLAVEVTAVWADSLIVPKPMFALRTIGWIYMFVTIVYVVCLFDFICSLHVRQIVRFADMLRDEEISIVSLCEEFFRLQEHLRRTSHFFRQFITFLILATTVGVLLGLYVFFEHSSTERPSILVLICIEVIEHVFMSIAIIRGGSKCTHFCEKIPGYVSLVFTASSLSMLVQHTSSSHFSLRRSLDTATMLASHHAQALAASYEHQHRSASAAAAFGGGGGGGERSLPSPQAAATTAASSVASSSATSSPLLAPAPAAAGASEGEKSESRRPSVTFADEVALNTSINSGGGSINNTSNNSFLRLHNEKPLHSPVSVPPELLQLAHDDEDHKTDGHHQQHPQQQQHHNQNSSNLSHLPPPPSVTSPHPGVGGGYFLPPIQKGIPMFGQERKVRAHELEVLYNCVMSNPMGIRLYGVSINRDTLMKVASLYMALLLFLLQRILSNVN